MNSGTFYKFLVYGILTLFLSLIFTVVYVANKGRSGKTGLDAAQMQVTREEQRSDSSTPL